MSQSEFIPRHDWAVRALNSTERESIAFDLLSDNLGLSLGPYMLALWVDVTCLGAAIILFNRWWYQSRESDTWRVRSIVYFSFFLSLGITVYTIVFSMRCFVYQFGTFLPFIEDGWTSIYYILDGVARAPVSFFFAERAWSMAGKNKIFGALLAVLIVASVASCILAKVFATGFTRDSLTTPKERIFVAIWLILNVVTDVLVTGTIAVRLIRSRTGWKTTDKVITKLLVLVGETQLPPTIFEITFLIISLVSGDSTVPAFFVCTPKVYLLCLMWVLDQRGRLRSELGGSSEYASYTHKSKRSRAAAEVLVQTEVYVHTDDAPNSIPLQHVSINRGPSGLGGAGGAGLDRVNEEDKSGYGWRGGSGGSDKDSEGHELDVVVLPQYGSPMGRSDSAGTRGPGGAGESTLSLPVYQADEEERRKRGGWGV